MLRQKPFDVRRLRVMFCQADVLVRNKDDLQSLPKAAPRYTPATHLGLDPRRAGYFMFLHEYNRFTTCAYEDTSDKTTNDKTNPAAPVPGDA